MTGFRATVGGKLDRLEDLLVARDLFEGSLGKENAVGVGKMLATYEIGVKKEIDEIAALLKRRYCGQ